MVAGFILSHLGMLLILFGFAMPRYYDIFVPPRRRAEGTEKTIANVPMARVVEPDATDPTVDFGETGLASSISPNKSSDDEKKLDS